MSTKKSTARRPQFRQHSSVSKRPVTPRPKRQSQSFGLKFSRAAGWLTLLALFLVSLFVFLQQSFVVRRVGCIINRSPTPCSASLWAAANKLLGKPMLFADYQTVLESTRSAFTDFDWVTYYKLIPDTVIVDYHFPEPAYQIAIENGPWLGYSTDARFTVATSSGQIIQVHSFYPSLNDQLASFQVDELIHQKLLELAYFSLDNRENWQNVSLLSLNLLRIETPEAVYDIDLFDLDRCLQKMWYVQKNRHPEKRQEIDLRLNVPVVRDWPN